MAKKNQEGNGTKSSHNFPPVVAVVGHVDHGKTTLLDTIRKSNIAKLETGGITQKIGASVIEVMHDKLKRRITFIDTPGHEAFFAMRSRGTKAADIGLLVISATDGVMPQTKESIKLLLDAKIQFIVVITKVDLPEKNVEKVKQQLLKENVMLEGLGGDVPVIEVSTKTNKNITELLELILLVFDLHADMFANRSKDAAFEGIVIESRMDQQSGPRTSLVVKNGTIHVRDAIVAGKITGKARTLLTDQNKHVEMATVGDAIEILGFQSVPAVGSAVYIQSSIGHGVRGPALGFPPVGAPLVSPDGAERVRAVGSPSTQVTPQDLHHDENALSIILVADTHGSLEAILNALPKEIVIVLYKTGDITHSDVFLAKSTKSIIVGFNSVLKPNVVSLAKTEKIPMKNYTLIYELLDELKDVMEGKTLALEEEVFGKAKVLASFPYEKTKVLGIVVVEGRIAKGDKVRLMRDETVIGESTIISVRQGKNPTSKIEKNTEGGIVISPLLDFTIGDVLICHR